MKEGWTECNLEDYIKLIDYRGRTPVKTENGVRLITAKNVKLGYLQLEPQEFIAEDNFESWMTRGIPNFGDVIFTTEAPLANVAQIVSHEKLAFAQRIIVMQPNPTKIGQAFLKYMLLSPDVRRKILAKGTGATVTGIKSSLLKKIQISFPPLPEQQRIVSILDQAFTAIEKAKANAEQNLQNAKELFESYLQGVFEKKGDGWEERKLGDSDLLKIIDGDRGKNYPRKKDFLDEGHCLFMNTKNVRPDGFDFSTTMFITKEKDNSMGKGKLEKNDVVLTTRGTIGNIGVNDDSVEYENIRINSGMLIFRPNKKLIAPHYLFEVFRSGIFKEQVKRYTTGAAQPQLPIKTLVNFTIPVPITIEAQQSIVRKLDALRAETQKLEAVYQKKLDDLEELKKSILQKAFRGELVEPAGALPVRKAGLGSPEGVGYDNEAVTPLAEKENKSPERV